MKNKITLLSAVLFTSAVCLTSTASLAATASDSMHYGKPAILKSNVGTSDSNSIVITNCTDNMENVSAQFVDGSDKTMTIYPQYQYPMNVISIDNSYPYVNIEVDATDGTVLYPDQPVYPGQHVNIGCDATAKLGKLASVTVSSH